MVDLPFVDRADAGRVLGAELAFRGFGPEVIVLGLARGGLPVAEEAARALGAPLDVMVVRKLGVPWQPELAMGAIAGKIRVLDQELIGNLRLSRAEVEAVTEEQTREAARRERLYREGLPSPRLEGRTVVLVDDGLATGSTMTAAVRAVRSAGAARVVVAVPVASSQACARLRQEADECICLEEPEPFLAVGEWYEEFHQLTDAEVWTILRRYKAGGPHANIGKKRAYT